MKYSLVVSLLLYSLFFPKQSIFAQEYGYDLNLGPHQVFIELQLKNFSSQPLIGERIVVTCEKIDFKREYITKGQGIARFVALVNQTYEVSFILDPFYYSIKTPSRSINQPIIKVIYYEGTKAVERMLKERLEREKIAMERWGTKSPEIFKNDLDKFSHPEYDYRERSVLKVLNRNTQWKNKLIITDITGSMYPYIGQVLLWFKMNYHKEKTTQLAFFNDGDRTPDHQKVIGETGGIYYCQDCDTAELRDVMNRAMASGYGGDGPENDLEAVIKSVKNIHKFKEVILIADNNSAVKDITLLDSVNVPVRVILCGVNPRVSAEYLDIAYQTKGSMHTIEQDLFELKNMKNGMILKIEGKSYRLRKGKFVLTGE